MQHFKLSIPLILLASTGCANLDAVYRSYHIQGSGTRTAVIDAKQRAITSVDRKNTADIRVCSEPPPDAVSAISGAFGASGGNAQVQAELAAAFSSTVGKLTKRNATVELLRYLAFSRCQAFSNGGISGQQYADGLEQISDLSITLLAIEQVTSPNAGDGTLVISPGKSGAIVSLSSNGGGGGGKPEGSTNSTEGENQPSPPAVPANAGTPTDGEDSSQPDSSDTTGTPDNNSSSTASSSDETDANESGEAKKGDKGKRDTRIAVTAGEGGEIHVSSPGQNQGVPPALAKEVREMLKLALTKRIKDSCLGGLRDLSLDTTSVLTMSDEKKIARSIFIQACHEILSSNGNDILPYVAILQNLDPKLQEKLKGLGPDVF